MKRHSLGILVALVVALLLPAAAFADTAPTAVPGAPGGVTATKNCTSDVVGACPITVTWSDSSGDATSFTITGNVSDDPTTVSVSGPEPSLFSVTFPISATNGADTSYSVVASNAAGSSAPATATVRLKVTGGLPPCVDCNGYGADQVSAPNNGAKDDVLTFHTTGRNGKRVRLTINGRHYRRVVRKDRFTITIEDRNGRKWTTYQITFDGITKIVRVR